MTDESRTVRVELSGDVDHAQPVESPNGPSNEPGTGLTLIVLAVAAIFLLAFVPSIGGGDAGTAGAPVSSEPARTRQPLGIEAPSTTARDPSGAVVAADPRLYEVESIRRTDDGLVALLGGAQTDALPRLLWSVDGRRWVDVEVVRPGLDITPNGLERRYSHLITTTSGLAMLETIVGSLEQPSDVADAPVRIRRWISDDGQRWLLDPDFVQIEAPPGRRLGVWEHAEDSFVAFAAGTEDERLLSVLLDTWIVDGALTNEPCVLDGSGGLDLAIFSCTAGSRIILSTEDLVEPVTMHQLLACATELRGGRFQVFDLFTSTSRGDRVDVSRNHDQSLFGWDVVDAEMTIVFDGGSSATFDRSTCAGLLEIEEQRPPSLTIRRGAAAEAEVALPEPMSSDFDRSALGRATRVVGGTYFAVVGDTVWSLDTTSGAWTALFELADTSGDTVVEFGEDANFIVESDPGSVTRIELSTGSRRVISGLRSTRARLVHFDETSAYLLGSDGLSVIDWSDAALVVGE